MFLLVNKKKIISMRVDHPSCLNPITHVLASVLQVRLIDELLALMIVINGFCTITGRIIIVINARCLLINELIEWVLYRLFNYGIGIHLLESDKAPAKKSKINPKDNHISFQCSDMNLVIKKLEEKNIEYVTAVVEEGGITVDQLFFHDPDGHMVEICNCQNLPVLPLSACPIKLPKTNGKLASSVPSLCGKVLSKQILLLRF
jgi:extradiol dioxygenase family protein